MWDNPALISPNTAGAIGVANREPLGVTTFEMARIEYAGRALELPVWVVPGMADGVVALTVGYVLFFVIHIAQVIRAGWNNFRAMVTGYELVPGEGPSHA